MAETSALMPVLSQASKKLQSVLAPGGGITPAGSRMATTVNAGSQALPSGPGQFNTLAGGSVLTPATPQMNVTAQVQPVPPQSANPLPTPPTTTPIAMPKISQALQQNLSGLQGQALEAGNIGPLPTYDPNLDFTLDPALAALRQQQIAGVGSALSGENLPGAAILAQFDALRDPLREQYGQQTQQLLKNTAIAGRGGLGHVGTQFGDLELALGRSEQNLAAQLAAEAAKADTAARMQGLTIGGQFLSDEQQNLLQQLGMRSQAEQAATGFGLQGAGLQNEARQQSIQNAAQLAGEQARLEAQRMGLSLQQQEAQANEAYRRTALQQEGALTREGFRNQQQIAGIHAAAQQAASQAAADASRYGADRNAQTQAANLAYQREADRMSNLLAVQGMENQMSMFGANLAQQQQQFQYGMSRDPIEDQFRTLQLLGQYGYMGAPDQNAAQGYLQNAYGQGVSNYGADAAQSGASAGQAISGLAQLPFIYNAIRPAPTPQIPFIPGMI